MMWHAEEYGSLSHRFTQGQRAFSSDRKKGNFIKKKNLGIKTINTRKWKPNAEQEPCYFNQDEPLMLIV